MEETLHVAGASPELQTLARSLLGEVTLSANQGQLGTQQERPQAAMLQRYERHRHDAETALRQAIQELATTGQVSDATLRAVSVPRATAAACGARRPRDLAAGCRAL